MDESENIRIRCSADKLTMTKRVKNTLVFDFKSVKKKPSNFQLHKCMKGKLNFSVDQLLCIQFDHLRNKVFIKPISNLLVHSSIHTFENKPLEFEDDEGNKHFIPMSEDVDDIDVKVHDFPLEMDNDKIRKALSQYGPVKSIRNDTYTGQGLYPVVSGARSILIAMKRTYHRI
ncbi:hypothetical protein HHI36_004135 [Cryptolaemus montrouzieri]|uniref:Uncharacterized protein n=1 Tax=Cryptolaemus montrouzieri TaxID=559131 RepID=A0ABD2NQA7_9CUCU